MAITHTADGAATSGLTSLTPALPAGFAVDDWHLLVVQTSNQDPGAITGWTPVTALVGSGTAAASGSVGIRAYWRFAHAGDTAPTVPDSGDHQLAWITGFRGVDKTNPISAFASNTAASSTTVTIPAVTSTIGNCFVIGLNANSVDSNTTQITSFAAAGLTSVNTLTTTSTNANSGTGGGVQGAYGTLATPGSSGTFTATQGTASVQARLTIAIQPAIVLTGSQGAGAAGSAAPVNSAALTGKVATAGQGAVTPNFSLTGAQATGSIGSLAVSYDAPMAGVSAESGVAQALSAGAPIGSMLLVTQAVSAQAPTVPGLTFALGGLQASGASGFVTPDTGSSTSAALTGTSATGSPGTLSVSMAEALAGSPASGVAGAPSPGAAPALAGAAATTASGTVTPASAPVLSGQAAAAGQGTAVPGSTASISGKLAATAQGAPTPGLGPVLAGAAASASPGALAPSTAPALTGRVATAAAGTTSPGSSLPLSGQAASAAKGIVSVGGSPDVTLQLSGAAAAGAAGAMTMATAAAIAGVEAAGAIGPLQAFASFQVSGRFSTGDIGQFVPVVTLALSGVLGAGGRGAPEAAFGVAPGSAAAALSEGVLGVDSALAMTGSAGFGHFGSILPGSSTFNDAVAVHLSGQQTIVRILAKGSQTFILGSQSHYIIRGEA